MSDNLIRQLTKILESFFFALHTILLFVAQKRASAVSSPGASEASVRASEKYGKTLAWIYSDIATK